MHIQVEYPEIDEDAKPRHRFMSSYEQKKESWDKKYQFLLFAAEPYEVIAFKVTNMEVEHSDKLSGMCCFHGTGQLARPMMPVYGLSAELCMKLSSCQSPYVSMPPVIPCAEQKS